MIEDIKESLKSVVHPSEESRFDLKTALRNLDEIVIQEGTQMDTKLRHFLNNRSYEKALLWIEGGEPEKGVCQK